MTQDAVTNPARTYEEYFVPAIFAPWASVLLRYACVARGERVLDVACGTGIVARKVAPMVGEEGRVVGSDPSPHMLAVARSLPSSEGAPIEWVQADALQLPDGPFDLVVCQQGLQFFPDRDAAARQMRSVLAEGGRVVIAVWQSLEKQPVVRELIAAEAEHFQEPLEQIALPFSFGDADDLRAVLERAGFREVQVHSETLLVRFASPEHYVEKTIEGAAAVIPALAEMDAVERSARAAAVRDAVSDTVRAHVVGEELVFPMQAYIAVAGS